MGSIFGQTLARDNTRTMAKLQTSMSAERAHFAPIDPKELPGDAIIFGRTPAMREIRAKVERALQNDLPVLIQGESGTGKEVIAKFLHVRSRRRDMPFLKLNCAAIPAGLLEGELFGYEKRAFIGDNEIKRGMVETAEEGTIFLDEVGELDWATQLKLVRLLQDGRFVRTGGTDERSAHMRVICATNFDLQIALQKHTFRQDLLACLGAVSLHLSPLRERKEDIPAICEYLLGKLAKEFGKETPQLSPAALHLLKQWNWPGNLRELENWIARIVVFGTEEVLGFELVRKLSSIGSTTGRKHRVGHLKEGALRRPRRHSGS
jgi:transcriptional regulator with PAS, ATPase and Fis domain